MPVTRISSLTRKRARNLRNDMTWPEQKLWQALRDLKPLGLHFRRQAPIGPYIADFVLFKQKLIVEVDGHTHSTEAELAHDHRRTQFLEAEGFKVIRCSNEDVMRNDEGVVMEILTATGKDK